MNKRNTTKPKDEVAQQTEQETEQETGQQQETPQEGGGTESRGKKDWKVRENRGL